MSDTVLRLLVAGFFALVCMELYKDLKDPAKRRRLFKTVAWVYGLCIPIGAVLLYFIVTST